MTWNKYFDPLSLGQCDLVAGLNTVVITVQATTVPNLDCMDVITDSVVISQTGVGGGTRLLPRTRPMTATSPTTSWSAAMKAAPRSRK